MALLVCNLICIAGNKSVNLQQKIAKEKEIAQIIHSKPMTNDEIPAAKSPLLS